MSFHSRGRRRRVSKTMRFNVSAPRMRRNSTIVPGETPSSASLMNRKLEPQVNESNTNHNGVSARPLPVMFRPFPW